MEESPAKVNFPTDYCNLCYFFCNVANIYQTVPGITEHLLTSQFWMTSVLLEQVQILGEKIPKVDSHSTLKPETEPLSEETLTLYHVQEGWRKIAFHQVSLYFKTAIITAIWCLILSEKMSSTEKDQWKC